MPIKWPVEYYKIAYWERLLEHLIAQASGGGPLEMGMYQRVIVCNGVKSRIEDFPNESEIQLLLDLERLEAKTGDRNKTIMRTP